MNNISIRRPLSGGRTAAILLMSITAFLLLLSYVSDAHAQSTQVQQYSIGDFLSNTNYRGGSFSPDGETLLVSSDESGVFNAYAIPVDGGEPVQLTSSSDDAIRAVSYFPDDERFLYRSDQGGNELDHLYVREEDGAVTDLTPGDRLRATFYDWAADGNSFFVGTNERDPRFFDVYEYDAETYEREMIYENTEGVDIGGVGVAFSPDGRYIALHKPTSNADTDIYLYDRERSAMSLLTDGEGNVHNIAQTFGPGGRYLYYTSDRGDDFKYLVRHDLESGKIEKVVDAEWSVWTADLSEHGTYLTVRINNDASTELRIYETETMTPVALPELPDANITSVTLSDDEDRMAFYASSSRMPSDLFVAPLDGGAAKQLTSSLNPAIDPADLVEGEVVRFPSYDDLEIPGILYRPHQASTEAPVPAIVWVHGGPGGQSRIGYTPLIQYLVNHGYAVYAINNRGSSGYGKTFHHLDDKKHGEADLGDVVESKEMLARKGWIDGERIGILGGSYGGFMTLAALAFRPQVFDAGVDIVGISNWVRTVQSIPPWWEAVRVRLETEMGDFDDEAFFRAKSPLFHADQIVKPLMVLQGANDPRVKKAESDDIVEAVRENDVPVEYIVFEDEGHRFEKKENKAHGYEAILHFLDRYLREEAQ